MEKGDGGDGQTGGGEGELERGGGGGGNWLVDVHVGCCLSQLIYVESRGEERREVGVGGLMLFNDTCLISVRIFGVMYYHTFSKLADHRWIEEQGYTK